MMLLLFAVGVSLGGAALSEWFWEHESRRGRLTSSVTPSERVAAGLIASLALVIAFNWVLSVPRLLSRGPLLICALVAGLLGSRSLLHARQADRIPSYRKVTAPSENRKASRIRILGAVGIVVAGLPLVLWLLFVLWRGALLGPLHHDALSYHMPKAVMIARAGGYRFFDVPEPRIPTMPSNFELLLADVLVLDGSDRVTEWVGTLSYILLLVMTVALVERWWGRGVHAVTSCLLVAAVPITLLHSGAHKNDLLAGALCLGAFMWGGRWAARGEWAAALLTIVCLGIALGVKPNALLAVAATGTIVAAGALRRRQLANHPRPVLAVAIAGVAALALFGGVVPYLDGIRHRGVLFTGLTANANDPSRYGDWSNLWEAPIMFWLVPFLPGDLEVWVPWRSTGWYWPRYELYFSNFGAALSLLVLTLPIALWLRRRGLAGSAQIHAEREVAGAERRFTALAALATFALVLPIRFQPSGFYSAYPRYVLFLPSILVAATVPALQLALARRWPVFAATLGLAMASGAFCFEALEAAVKDRFVSFEFVMEAAHDESRRRVVPFMPNRAALVVDRWAAADDTIAIDGSTETWIYPAFGRELTRNIVFIAPDPGPVTIPDAARWAIVDRSLNSVWGHPDFHHLGQWRRYLGEGPLLPEDLRVYQALLLDPRWELVFDVRRGNQAVFRRRGPQAQAP
jgi:hypothetical protein